jgi:hypothetical protein
MFKCGICGNNIKYQNLQKVFQFTLGNMTSDKFVYENSNIYYYHINCLNKIEKTEPKFLTPLI